MLVWELLGIAGPAGNGLRLKILGILLVDPSGLSSTFCLVLWKMAFERLFFVTVCLFLRNRSHGTLMPSRMHGFKLDYQVLRIPSSRACVRYREKTPPTGSRLEVVHTMPTNRKRSSYGQNPQASHKMCLLSICMFYGDILSYFPEADRSATLSGQKTPHTHGVMCRQEGTGAHKLHMQGATCVAVQAKWVTCSQSVNGCKRSP